MCHKESLVTVNRNGEISPIRGRGFGPWSKAGFSCLNKGSSPQVIDMGNGFSLIAHRPEKGPGSKGTLRLGRLMNGHIVPTSLIPSRTR